ncbi:MAG: hypothetical protein KDD06_28345 [Phaeodactylibacter sp.]|nr:hypothetical protein [Phaeodactylibacter sp.]MCB9290446.1 phosphopeptide-binding protein [Lewinellaceae bacterium]
MRTLSLFLAMAAMILSACQGGSSSQEQNQEQQEEPMTEMKYSVTPFSPSASYPDAKIESMSFTNGKFDFTLNDSDYQLGVQTPDAGQKMCANSAKGQHIHLIVDNEPYAAKYESSFDYEIPDGDHFILAFLSRSYHESIKTEGAHVAIKAAVKGNSITESKPITIPMLFYSRPKGTYTGKAETEKVMLDFYLVNAKLGDEYKVKAEINGEEHMIDSWQPYYVEGLPMGENTIKLTLVDSEGNTVDTPLNPVSRTFTLQEDPVEQ